MMTSWIKNFEFEKFTSSSKVTTAGFVYFMGQKSVTQFKAIVEEHALTWQKAALLENQKDTLYFVGANGPVWILSPPKKTKGQHDGLLDESPYAWARDQFGSMLSHFRVHQLSHVTLKFHGASPQIALGCFVGFELAAYSFKEVHFNKPGNLPQLCFQGLGKEKSNLKEAIAIAGGVNFARHLVNLPGNDLNPESFVQKVKSLKLSKTMKATVWDESRLKKEGMFLHYCVGQGATHGPRMLHLQYRPTKKTKQKPIAFVGKGITFDTGGLDIKNSSGMRLMKKDMGGAAAVAGIALWASESQYPHALDFYLALAENSVDANSMRPGDIYKSRSGFSVEIDNTDAEGRLVLADCLDVAVTAKGNDEPEAVINIATLTGAIKSALGTDVAGLFSNHDKLANQVLRAGAGAGDYFWRVPLIEKYFSSMSSHFADFKNSGDGWGGAVTAALFLQKFVRNKPWVHLDIYAWSDKAHGALSSAGGSGQAVQGIIGYLKSRG